MRQVVRVGVIHLLVGCTLVGAFGRNRAEAGVERLVLLALVVLADGHHAGAENGHEHEPLPALEEADDRLFDVFDFLADGALGAEAVRSADVDRRVADVRLERMPGKELHGENSSS